MKLENARSRLLTYVDQQERQSFAYGTNDCLMMTAGAVLAVLDDCPNRRKVEKIVARYRGRYTTLAGGKRLIRKAPLALVASIFTELDHHSDADDGDIAAKPIGAEWTFGVIIGAHFYVQAEAGLGILPRSDALKVFKVE